MKIITNLFLISLVLLFSFSVANSSTAVFNFSADVGDCEFDTNFDGLADGWVMYRAGTTSTQTLSDIKQLGIIPSLSSNYKISGKSSQEIDINTNNPEKIGIGIEQRPIPTYKIPYFAPPIGTPLLVKAYIKTENLNNFKFLKIYAISGNDYHLLAELPTSTSSAWKLISSSVPLKAVTSTSVSGEIQYKPKFHFLVYFELNPGPASGKIWIDSLEVLGSQYSFQPWRSNILKFAHFPGLNDWRTLLSPPVGFFITLNISQVNGLKFYLPNIWQAIYVDSAQTVSSTPPWWNDLFGGYKYVLENHRDWLLTSSSTIFADPDYPNNYSLDINKTDVQEQAKKKLKEMVQNTSFPEWIYFDVVGQWWKSDQYPTLTSTLPAWDSYVENVFTYVHNELGRKIMFNIGSYIGSLLDGNNGEKWMKYADGVLLEHTLTYYRRYPPYYFYHNYRSTSTSVSYKDGTWWTTLRAIEKYPDKVIIILAMADPNYPPNDPNVGRKMFRYVLASYFLMAQPNVYLEIEPRATRPTDTYKYWINQPEVYVPLGAPLGNWYVASGTAVDNSGALFARNFRNGIVLVNPTENKTFTFTLPETYKNWDDQIVPKGTKINIATKTGLVFYKGSSEYYSNFPVKPLAQIRY